MRDAVHSASLADSSGLIPELALDGWQAYLVMLGSGSGAGSTSGEPASPDAGHCLLGGEATPAVDRSAQAQPVARRYRPGERFSACPGAPEMLVLPPGRFLLGAHPLDPDAQSCEKPCREITIPYAFAVSLTPITFAQWDACVAAGGTRHIPSDATWGRGDRPVINVSWHDAEEYVGWLARQTGDAFRMLSESEWEYACRGETVFATRYPWGDDYGFRQLEHHAWYHANSGLRTQPVAGRQANAWGLFDFLGNVAEWVEDHFSSNYSVHPADGSAHRTAIRGASRVLRGGSWLDSPRAVRPSARDRFNPDHRSYKSGFRVALTVELDPAAGA
jgi:formylglycine-generating enzyme required for sulfatase activity